MYVHRQLYFITFLYTSFVDPTPYLLFVWNIACTSRFVSRLSAPLALSSPDKVMWVYAEELPQTAVPYTYQLRNFLVPPQFPILFKMKFLITNFLISFPPFFLFFDIINLVSLGLLSLIVCIITLQHRHMFKNR